VFDLFLEVFSCVLTVGISPTKSMSTKSPKLGKTFLKFQIRFNSGCIYIYIYMCKILITCRPNTTEIEVVERLLPGVFLYENVQGAAHKCRDKKGNTHRPAIEVVQEDMDALQYQTVLRSGIHVI